MSMVDVFRKHSQVLASKAEASETIHHPGDRGAECEDILEDFLSPLLPEKFGIGSGEIRATNGAWSKQGDLIIYDRLNCPRLFVGARSQVYPAESVGAVIEVKKRLDTKGIREATENIRRARSLDKVGMSTHLAGSLTLGKPTPILGALFTYNLAISLKTFRERWNEAQSVLAPERRINLVCILGEMVIVHLDQTFHLWDQIPENKLNSFNAMDSKENSLFVFTLFLMRALTEMRFGIPDLFKYMVAGETLSGSNPFENF